MADQSVFLLAILSILITTFLGSCFGKDVAPGISDHLYCEGCVATVTELAKMTSKKSSDPRDLIITEALENICKPYNFVNYDFSPPKTVKACQLLLERHEEEIETALAKKSNDLEKEICFGISKACVNVDRSKKPSNHGDVDLTMNGKGGKVEKVFDPNTGKATKSKEGSGKGAETLSKKDRTGKKVKKEGKLKNDKKKDTDALDYFQLDMNDPNSVNKVMAQIKQATQEHTNKFYMEQELKEMEKEEKEEQQSKDEL